MKQRSWNVKNRSLIGGFLLRYMSRQVLKTAYAKWSFTSCFTHIISTDAAFKEIIFEVLNGNSDNIPFRNLSIDCFYSAIW